MSDQREGLLYVSRVEGRSGEGALKLLTLPTEQEPVRIGSHGALARHYGYPDEGAGVQATTLDYLVAALAGCMMGTFLGALKARNIVVAPDDFVIEAEGSVELRQGVPVLTVVDLVYRLRVTQDVDRPQLQRAFDHHPSQCAVHRSIGDAIQVNTSLVTEYY